MDVIHALQARDLVSVDLSRGLATMKFRSRVKSEHNRVSVCSPAWNDVEIAFNFRDWVQGCAGSSHDDGRKTLYRGEGETRTALSSCPGRADFNQSMAHAN